ncbi:transporter substrate-binding domain-containing protein [Legionella sp. km535]|uniref:transporter substrate-binding domain-containing protein n=1 Tax=Legionella sp. km535 TaxID=2498107 RepID=UPI000F8CB2A5|nr:transporter substrate-binding domain-containing protein [Legionella sp. km535]RUR20702.1 transporter substrate-binding domain-containing protein [Legionella sp. km535]
MKKILGFILFISSTLLFGTPITVGFIITPPYAVFADVDKKEFYGFNIDLMNEICKRIKEDCVYKAITFNNELAELQDGTVDLEFTQIPITNDPTGNYLFSLPYLISDGQFVTLSNNKLNAISDLKNKRIGVITDTLYQILLNSNYDDGLITRYSNFPDMISALENNKIDAVFINNHLAHYMVYNASLDIKMIGNKIPIGEGYGILGLQTNKALIDKVNTALLSMESDGTYLNIYTLYFGEDQ